MSCSEPNDILTVSNQLNDIDNTVSLKLPDQQIQDDSSSAVIHSQIDKGSSFQFGSGTTLADESQAVYFVLEPSTGSEGLFSKKPDVETCTLIQSQNSEPHAIRMPGSLNNGNQGVEVLDSDNKCLPGRTRAGITKCLEPSCSFICSRIPQLRSHLEDVHGIQQESKVFAFSSEKDFKAWLSAVEREARCSFMRRRGWQSNKNGSLTACFYCNRGGAYTSKATKKQMKTQGSCKTGVECTSSMKVTMVKDLNKYEDGSVKHVQVEAYLQHYGHNLDLTHTRLTQSEKQDIARKLSRGISRNKILDDIRGTLDASATPHRLHLLSLQDLYNIEKKEGIKAKGGKNNNDEGTTVQAWIEKMQKTEDNPVLLIKYQQEKAKEVCSCLGDDDFILILQTPLQAMMLRRYGPHQCICMDITKGEQPTNGSKNEPNFYLMSLEVMVPVLNDREEIFPVAWFVCNRKDKAVIEIFFSQIKDNLSGLTLTPSYLLLPGVGITGGCDWFNVWTSIFGSGPRKLLCSWHIIDEFKQRIQRISSSASNAEEARLITNLQTVLGATAVDGFLQLRDQFVADLSKDQVTLPLANFFKSNYSAQPEVWSRAYRSESHVQAEVRFEEYHKKISRHIYHEGFKRKQLDVLIKTLMRNSRDRALHKLRQSFKLTNDVSIRRMTLANHWNSVSLPINFVSPHEDPRVWSVMSVVDRVRAVERSSESGQPILLKKVAVEYIVNCAEIDRCPARLMCAYRCEDCGICSHHFTCTCQNDQKSLIAGEQLHVLCEHCHLVVRYMRENQRKVETLLTVTSEQTSDKTEIEGDVQERSDQLVVMVLGDEQEIASPPVDNSEAAPKEDAELPCEAEVADIENLSSQVDRNDLIDDASLTDTTTGLIVREVKHSNSQPSVRRSSRPRKISYKAMEQSRLISSSKETRSSNFECKSKRYKLSS